MWHTKAITEIRRELNSNLKYGIDSREVEKRKEMYGENEIAEQKKKSILIRFIEQFNDFMIITLLVAAIISSITAYIQGTNDYIDSIIIVAIVVFNAFLGVIQESKAEKALEALKKLSAPTAKVKRDNRILEIPSKDVVVGDILILEAGAFVPADCRLIEAFNFKVEESALTGENLPVQKDADVILDKNSVLGDMVNMAFATTIVTNGHAEAIVTDVGMNTKVGQIAKMIMTDVAPETPLQQKLGEVGKKLGLVALGICFVIFIIGLLKRIPPIEMFMTSVGLAVAAIPEGVPAIVTIMLSIGVTKMARKNAIIRKLPAVETLGSSTVICSDKTGTLTQNKMEVVELRDTYGDMDLQNRDANLARETRRLILRLASMCTDVNIQEEFGEYIAVGEPTEVAIVNAGLKINENKEKLYTQMERVNEIPFDSTRKLMTTIHKMGNKYRIITKGAPDVLIRRCNKFYDNGVPKNLTEDKIQSIHKNNTDMAEKALRVIAVAYVDVDIIPTTVDTSTIEKDLIFVGLIGMIDPPRVGVKEAVETCRRAGIKTVMITGDHIITAKAIASELGILRKTDKAITGIELDKISDDTLEKEIKSYSVFARVSPEHKVRIVKAFRANGEIVAMTGDGVNDAPALKNADIGVSMGLNGTDVAKNASDMILTDDNFVTITEAVKTGRHIYDNIRKAVHFLIATNVGEIVTIFVGLLLGIESPLLAIHLLWINLVTDSFPAIALGLDPIDKQIMNKKPRNSKKGLFSDGLWGKIFVEGTMIGILTLLAFSIGNNLYGLKVGRTMAFVSLSMLELIHSFNIRSEESIFKIGLFTNKYLIGALILGSLLQVGVIAVPVLANIFDVVALNGTQWIYTILISISPLIIMELQKRLNDFKFGKVVYRENDQEI